VKQVWENSPADHAGLSVGDECVAVNGMRVGASNFESVMLHFESVQELKLTVFRADRLETITLQRDPGFALERYMLVAQPSPTAAQIDNRIAWMRVD
jgi:predicted metalloprotease with PDZ domain